MDEQLPNFASAMYQTIRRQYTKVYGGNWRSGCGGTLTKYAGKSRKTKSLYQASNTIYNEAVHHLFIDFKKAHDSLRREVLYNNLIELGSPEIDKANKNM